MRAASMSATTWTCPRGSTTSRPAAGEPPPAARAGARERPLFEVDLAQGKTGLYLDQRVNRQRGGYCSGGYQRPSYTGGFAVYAGGAAAAWSASTAGQALAAAR